MLSKRPSVSVIIPTLNESPNLPLVLPFLPLTPNDEVILVDGRSNDNTVETARQILPSIRVVLERRPGKGVAMQAGFGAAQGDILVTMDADGSNDPREIPRMVDALLEGADLVKGSRFAPGGGTTDMPRYRKLGNKALCVIANLLFNGTFTDLCYGYHAFWRHTLPLINGVDAAGFEIDTAIYVRALRHRLRVKETPSFEGYRFHGKGKLQTIPDGWRVLKTILNEWGKGHAENHDEPYRGFRGPPPNPETPPNAMETLNALTYEIAAEPNLQDRLERMLERLLAIVGAKSGSILILDEAGFGGHGMIANAGEFRAPTPGEVSRLAKSGLAGWVFQHRQGALVESTLDEPRWLRRPWERRANISRSVLCVPLALLGRPIGVITLATDPGGRFSQEDLALLSTLALGLSFSAASFVLPQAEPVEPPTSFDWRTESEEVNSGDGPGETRGQGSRLSF